MFGTSFNLGYNKFTAAQAQSTMIKCSNGFDWGLLCFFSFVHTYSLFIPILSLVLKIKECHSSRSLQRIRNWALSTDRRGAGRIVDFYSRRSMSLSTLSLCYGHLRITQNLGAVVRSIWFQTYETSRCSSTSTGRTISSLGCYWFDSAPPYAVQPLCNSCGTTSSNSGGK